jgi:hypothetical protein
MGNGQLFRQPFVAKGLSHPALAVGIEKGIEKGDIPRCWKKYNVPFHLSVSPLPHAKEGSHAFGRRRCSLFIKPFQALVVIDENAVLQFFHFAFVLGA